MSMLQHAQQQYDRTAALLEGTFPPEIFAKIREPHERIERAIRVTSRHSTHKV